MKKFKKIALICFGLIILSMGSFLGLSIFQYNKDISHRGASSKKAYFSINLGDDITKISTQLKNENLISSKVSFEIYAKLNKKTDFKAGRYELSENMTIPEIVDLFNSGQIAKMISVTFLPGGTLLAAKKSLVKSGYGEKEIDEAFSKDYSRDFPKLFEGKPENADLEGFFYGETHFFEKGTSVETILRRYFADFEKKIVDSNLKAQFEKQNLTTYQGIILASIVQRESIGCGAAEICEDQRQIAGVFLNRIKKGMNLGSDVTYQYIADKTGVERDVNLDSPYNLRKNTGLTPTPIATPSVSALNAVANPVDHAFLFFLSGDDDKTYFATTDAEHQKNIRNHCQEKCQII